MSVVAKILWGIGVIVLVVGSTSVIIAALFQPREYKGDGMLSKSDGRDGSIEDV